MLRRFRCVQIFFKGETGTSVLQGVLTCWVSLANAQTANYYVAFLTPLSLFSLCMESILYNIFPSGYCLFYLVLGTLEVLHQLN